MFYVTFLKYTQAFTHMHTIVCKDWSQAGDASVARVEVSGGNALKGSLSPPLHLRMHRAPTADRAALAQGIKWPTPVSPSLPSGTF